MTKEKAKELAMEIISKYNEKEMEIYEIAKSQGRLRPGLDSNKDLTKALDEELKQELQKIYAMIDEKATQ